MNRTPRTINVDSIVRQNDMNKTYGEDIVRSAMGYLTDPNKDQRSKGRECKSCWYLNNQRIGGAAITHKPCDVCENEMSFGSTCTDSVCKDCSDTHKLCTHCGGDIDMKDRRNRKPDGKL